MIRRSVAAGPLMPDEGEGRGQLKNREQTRFVEGPAANSSVEARRTPILTEFPAESQMAQRRLAREGLRGPRRKAMSHPGEWATPNLFSRRSPKRRPIIRHLSHSFTSSMKNRRDRTSRVLLNLLSLKTWFRSALHLLCENSVPGVLRGCKDRAGAPARRLALYTGAVAGQASVMYRLPLQRRRFHGGNCLWQNSGR